MPTQKHYELKQLKTFVSFSYALREMTGPSAFNWLVAFTEGVTEIDNGCFTFFDPGVSIEEIAHIAPSNLFSLSNLHAQPWGREVRSSGLKRLRFPSSRSVNKRLSVQIGFLEGDEHLPLLSELMVFTLLMDHEKRPMPFNFDIRSADMTDPLSPKSRLVFGYQRSSKRFTVLQGVNDYQSGSLIEDVGIAGIRLERHS